MNATYGVAPQDFVAPHPAKHMYLAPSELQSASVEPDPDAGRPSRELIGELEREVFAVYARVADEV